MSIYDLGMSYVAVAGLFAAVIVFLVYLIPICVSYVKGKNIEWDNGVNRNFNPLKNNEFSIIIIVPVTIILVSFFAALVWFISIPGIIIFLTLRYFRNINLSKQKMWNTLKGDHHGS